MSEQEIVLTPELIAIMEKAGITEAKIKNLEIKPVKKVTSKNKEIPAREYILENVRTCKLCGNTSTIAFYMARKEGFPSVLENTSINNAPEGLHTERRYKIWPTCSNCKDYLRNLDKELLVTMILDREHRREGWK